MTSGFIFTFFLVVTGQNITMPFRFTGADSVDNHVFSISNRQIRTYCYWALFSYLFFLGFALGKLRLLKTQSFLGISSEIFI